MHQAIQKVTTDAGTLHPKQPPPPRYRGTSLIRNSGRLGSYSRTMSRALRWSLGRRLFLVSEVSLKGGSWQDRVSVRMDMAAVGKDRVAGEWIETRKMIRDGYCWRH